MKKIKGTFNHAVTEYNRGSNRIRNAAKAFRQAHRNTTQNGHEYTYLTVNAGHIEPVPGIPHDKHWDHMPEHFELILANDKHEKVGRVDLYNLWGKPLHFEMDENLYNAAAEQLAKDNIGTLTPE